MICDKCLEEIQLKMINKKMTDGSVIFEVNNKKSTIFIPDGYEPYFYLWVSSTKTFKNGNTKNKEIQMVFKAKYCAECGTKI